MSSYPTLYGCQPGAGGDVVVLGLGFDAGTTSVRGAAQGPAALRQLTSGEAVGGGPLWDLRTRSPYFDAGRLSDLGDIPFRTSQRVEDYTSFVQEAVATVVGAGKRVLLLGGDHLITLFSLRAHAQQLPAFQVVQLDAHHDYREVAPGELPTHSTFISYVAAERLARKVIQVGVRGLAGALPADQRGVVQCELEQLEAELLPGVPVYLTVDTDAIDPVLAPGVGYPVHGGLSWSAIGTVLRVLERKRLQMIGADWTEYNPPLDTQHHLTGLGIVRGLAEILRSLLAAPPSVSRAPRPRERGRSARKPGRAARTEVAQ